MSVDITFLGHSGFVITSGEYALAIDPFLSGNPVATMSADELSCTHIAVTHGHADHFSDVPAIAKRTGATVYAAYEICEFLGEQGHEKCEPGNPGGRIKTPFGWIAFTQAFHSSSFNGRYMGMPCGIVAHIGGKTIYHCGDTALFGDMELIGELYRPDIAMIPVGDRFTMGPEQGSLAGEMIGADVAIPIHFGTWPVLAQDISSFSPARVEVRKMAPGATWRAD